MYELSKGHRFYQSRAWQKCQKGFLIGKCYVCERCGGVGTLAHHKERITLENVNDPNVTLNWSNLECLCAACHRYEHSDSKVTADGIAFDANGNVYQVDTGNGFHFDTPQVE